MPERMAQSDQRAGVRARSERALRYFTSGMLIAAAIVAVWTYRPLRSSAIAELAPRPVVSDTVAIFFLSSTCLAGASEPAASRFTDLLGDAVRRTERPRLMGVAVDEDARRGTQYLFDIARFDQVSAGGGWSNEVSLRYLFPNGLPPMANVPQLVVVERLIEVSGDTSEPAVTEIRVLHRALGLGPISDWIEQRSWL